ncbi:MAG TPA: N-acetylmuramoyl-L-alanine amidase [Chthoniobacterales bacterium]|jgi:N-acetylmuramoyl-L-alanine amidase|nr:N-acetylmuramoyl-L-alanine amidase [Chthoniobacterales bacterium]
MISSRRILPVVMRGGWVCTSLLFLLACNALGFDWTLIKHDGRDYVPVEDVAKFYSFTQADYANDTVNLEGATLRMQGAVNARELYLNGLKFILSFPIIKVDNKILMSRMDLSKLVEPVLRPAKISTAPVHTVVLDAGHGGYDQGAFSILGNEKDFALDVVERARDLLTKAGFNVRLTRSADVFVRLEDRAAFTNRQSNAIFVSVHFNAGAREDAGGVETYSLAPRGVPSTNNANVSLVDFQPCIGNLRDPENIALATAMHAALITKLRVSDRGIKRARFIVLRDCNIPAVLIEGGFLTNAQDRVRIATPIYRQMLAQAILQGVLSYNRAVRRHEAPDQMMVRRGDTSEQPATDPGASVWDPLRPNAYTLPEDARK